MGRASAAASPFLLLQARLGISAHAPGNRLDVERPRLPDWLGSAEVRDIRVGDSRVSLSFRTAGSGSTVSRDCTLRASMKSCLAIIASVIVL